MDDKDLKVAQKMVAEISALNSRLEAAVNSNRAAVTLEIAALVALMLAISSGSKEALRNAERLAKAGSSDERALESFEGFFRVIEHENTAAAILASLFGRMFGVRIEA